MVVVLVVIGSLFWNAALVVVAAVRRKRFEFGLKLGRKARAGLAAASSGSKQDLYRVQFNTIVKRRNIFVIHSRRLVWNKVEIER
jgi:hypothetical protein